MQPDREKLEAPDRETMEGHLLSVEIAIRTLQADDEEENRKMELVGYCSDVPRANLRVALATRALLRAHLAKGDTDA